MRYLLIAVLLTGCATTPAPTPPATMPPPAVAAPTEPPTRDAKQVRLFRKANPCPSTGQTTGACVGWVVDHKYPRCAGGADTPENMMWQDVRQSYIKDRVERDLCAYMKKARACE
jgi:hypothetical protein